MFVSQIIHTLNIYYFDTLNPKLLSKTQFSELPILGFSTTHFSTRIEWNAVVRLEKSEALKRPIACYILKSSTTSRHTFVCSLCNHI